MRRLITLFAAVLFAIGPAVPAAADHDQDYIGAAWYNSPTETYCFTGFGNRLGSVPYANVRDTTADRINTIESSTEVSANFVQDTPTPECATSYVFEDWDCTSIEISHPSMMSRVTFGDLSDPSDRAITRRCNFGGDGDLDFFWIKIDSDKFESGLMHWDDDSIPPNGDWDFAGLVNHEWVHALGFQGHWPGSSDACNNISVGVYNTMCNNSNAGILNSGNSNGTWWRSLEEHDIAELNQNYP